MQSTFDERNWLSWLVRVRIFILTLLLAIELAVAQFSPAPLPMRLFISTILFWFSLSLFYVLLLSFWQEHRLQASLQVLTDLVLVSLVVHETGGWDSSLNFLYPLVIIVASVLLPRVWAHLIAALAFHSLRHGAGAELLRRDSVVLHDAPGIPGAAGDHLRQPVRLPGGGVPGRAADGKAAPGRRPAERHQRRAGKPAGRCTRTSFTRSAAGWLLLGWMDASRWSMPQRNGFWNAPRRSWWATPVQPVVHGFSAHGGVATYPWRSSVRNSGKIPQDLAGASGGAYSAGTRRAGLRLCAGRP